MNLKGLSRPTERFLLSISIRRADNRFSELVSFRACKYALYVSFLLVLNFLVSGQCKNASEPGKVFQNFSNSGE